jgi:sodium-dependent dicarboxylate transporter 2/3/5
MSPNPGLLKLDLSIRGARLGESLKKRPDILRVPLVRNPVARSVELVLPESVSVSVPVGEEFTAASPFLLELDGGRTMLSGEGDSCEVQVVPAPRYYTKKTRAGTPMWRIASSYGPYISITPSSRCGFSRSGTSCAFCDVATQGLNRDKPLALADVIETLREAFDEGAVEFVYLHIGYIDTEDAGVEFLEPYVRAIKRHFDTLVAVQLQPPKHNRWIDRFYAVGVDALSYSIQIHDPKILEEQCEGRAVQVGRDRYYDALTHAASVFPSGTVWSDLIVGLEPIESTLQGIDRLVEMGVLPVLSVFRPLGDIELRDHPLPTARDVAPVFAHLFHRVRQARINMNWVRDLGFAVTPLEARFFAEGGAPTADSLRQLYRSKLGNMAVRNLSRLRRRLRVRQVSDSFDSSQL